MIDCGNQHSMGCDNKLKCCCGKSENVFTLINTQLIEGSLAIRYYDYTIKKVEERIRLNKIL